MTVTVSDRSAPAAETLGERAHAPVVSWTGDDYAEHVVTYRGFTRGVISFIGAVAVVLILMAYFLT